MLTSHLQQLLLHAYILGGSPCSGKSTVAEMIATQYGFHYYKADDYESEHMKRSRPDLQPITYKYSHMCWDEIWSQSPEQLLTDELAYYHERFPFILNDLHRVETEKPVVFEGAAFLPELIEPFSIRRERVAFMIPTMEFQLHHYNERLWIQSILSECHDPQQSFQNWMKRDQLFAREVARQANAYGFAVINVDGSVDIQGQLENIKAHFNL